MPQLISITAAPRTAAGKGAARQARLQKKVPAVVYGHGRASQSLEVDGQTLEQVLSGKEPSSTLVELTVDGKKARALIREIQRHPIRPDIIHIDFYEIHADEKVKLKVSVHLAGTPEGVRNAGGVLDQVTRDVEIAVLPEHIPDRVELDVTALTIGHSVHVRDLVIPNATILTHADRRGRHRSRRARADPEGPRGRGRRGRRSRGRGESARSEAQRGGGRREGRKAREVQGRQRGLSAARRRRAGKPGPGVRGDAPQP